MKKLRALFCLVLLAAGVPAFAGFASARPAPGNVLPTFPGVLKMNGITRGFAVVAVSIDAEGKVQDSLVLAYSQPPLARASLAAVRSWTFLPARLDGQAVPVQTELRFDYTLEGAVISTNVVNHYFYDNFDGVGDTAAVYQPGRADQLDGTLVKLAGEAPRYPAAAARDGLRGKVEVRFYVDENGDVRLPSVVVGAEHPYLAEQAVAAVRTWKFSVPRMYGAPVLVAAAQEFDFGGVR